MGGFACKSGLCRVSEVVNLQLWVTPQFPKLSLKRDRAVTKAPTVSPLSHHYPSVLRPNRVPCPASEVVNPQLWVTPQVPKPSPKRDRSTTERRAGSQLSHHCLAVLRPNRVPYPASEVVYPQLCVTPQVPKPSPKRDRAITKATAVSPLSPHCLSVLRPNRELCRVSEVVNLQLWVTPQVPKPSPKRDRAITKATAVSPLSPRCQPVLRRSRTRCCGSQIHIPDLRLPPEDPNAYLHR